MAIKTWLQDGKTFYQINFCARSRADRNIRAQRYESGSLDETDPELVRKKLSRIEARLTEEARREVYEREGDGIAWGELVKRWKKVLDEEVFKPNDLEKANSLLKPIRKTTAHNYIQSVVDFTTRLNEGAEPVCDWTNKPATQITPADVEDLFKRMAKMGYSNCRQYNVKVAISRCFRFAIMKRLVKGVTVSPTYGFGISRKESKRPEILNAAQIEILLSEAKRRNHPWRTIWEGVFHTGFRSGEAYELRAGDVDLLENRIYLEKKYNFFSKEVDDLKDDEWRQVPINDDLKELMMELGVPDMKPTDYVFPRINAWKNSDAAMVLRKFCEEVGVPSICFHTLRACWATQLLKNGVNELTLMKMGGWSDLETMQRYIRLAGIEVEGATQTLSMRRRERPGRVLKLVESG